MLLYRLDEADASLELLKSVLRSGQQAGLFRPFYVQHMALAIRGVITSPSASTGGPRRDPEANRKELSQ